MSPETADKLGRELSRLDSKITQACTAGQPEGFWQKRWPSIIDRYAELIEMGVWGIA